MNASHNPRLQAATAFRAEAWDAGWRPVALYSWDCPHTHLTDKDRGKRPIGKGWQDRARRDPPEAADAVPDGDALETGILCDGLRVLDLDIDDGPTVANVRALAVQMLGDTIVRSRDNSPRILLPYRAAAGTPPKRTLAGSKGKIEVLGAGQQFAAHERHPSGALLRWTPGGPATTPLHTVPAITEAQLDAFLAEAATLIGAEPEGDAAPGAADDGAHQSSAHGAAADPLDVKAALAVIPPDNALDWNYWNKIGLATWAATGGSEAGLMAFTAWTERITIKHDRKPRERWDHYTRHGDRPPQAGAGTLFYLAGQAQPGWRKQSDAPGAPGARPDRKRPLFRTMSPAPDFPIMALGEMRRAAEAIEEKTRAPIAVCAQSVLAAATLAVQAHYDVELPGAGRRPLTALFVSVLDSGERKSAVDRLAVRPAYHVEAGFRDAAQAAAAAHADEHETWEHARKQAKKASKANRAALADEFRKIGPEPKPPAHPMLLVADPTPEALVMHLAGRPWGGLFTAEGGLFLGGSAMNDETRMRTGALLNTLWDGDAIRRLRVTTGAAYLPGRRCSAHIMVQPAIASRFFADATLAGIGTLARTLLVAPIGTAGTRFFREASSAAAVVLADYDARLIGLMQKPTRAKGDDPTVLDPYPLPLHSDAEAIWIEFHDFAERAQGPEGPLRPIQAFASKMAEHAGRLAAVLTVYADPDAVEVGAEAMAGGIELAQHYAAELLRLHGAAGVSPDLELAARLLAWWQARPDPRCHLAAIYQRGLNAIRDAATARRIVGILEEHGYIDRLPARTEVDGAARNEAWELVP